MRHTLPIDKPERPFFSSGPCVKPKEWSLDWLQGALLGRSHRAQDSLDHIQSLLDELRVLLKIPPHYHVALTPGSATGAMDMAMWNLLGPRPVACITWDVFSRHWAYNAAVQLRLDVSQHTWWDFQTLNKEKDLILTWTGTTRGIWVGPHTWLEDWKGLVLCDATASAFIVDMPWDKLDATAFSWQKALAGEASSGILVLSPKAYHRLLEYTPQWPIGRLMRLKDQNNVVVDGIFHGYLVNTPSMLLLREHQALTRLWIEKGAMDFSLARCATNFGIIQRWTEHYSWMDFLESNPQARAHGPVCLKSREGDFSWSFLKRMDLLLQQQEAAYEVLNHAHDTPSLRIWAGPSVEPQDLVHLGPWLNWAYKEAWEECPLR